MARPVPGPVAVERSSDVSTLDDYLRAVAPYLPSALVAPESLAASGAVARLLPAAVTAHFGFESRLGVPEASVDFMLATSVAAGGRRILAGEHPGIPAPSSLVTNPSWERTREFVARWADPASPLSAGADHVCLEFDVAGAADPAAAAVPNVFFAPQDGNWVGDDARASADHVERARRTVEMGLEILAGGPLWAPTAAALARCFRELPAHAWVFQIGVMTARTPTPVRLQVSKVTPTEFLDFLVRVGWEGEVDALGALLDALTRTVDDVTYGVDLDGGVRQKIGLECYVRDDRLPAPEPRWEALLDGLVEQGLCLPAKRDAVLAYPGVSHEGSGLGPWPTNLARATGLLGGRVVPVFARYLHHVKVVFQDGRATEAKAYLGIGQQWISRAT